VPNGGPCPPYRMVGGAQWWAVPTLQMPTLQDGGPCPPYRCLPYRMVGGAQWWAVSTLQDRYFPSAQL
jgi:hypothetical protein